MPQVILISQFPLPYSRIGSWTTMYQNYLADKNQIDLIICKKPMRYFDTTSYSIVKDNPIKRMMRKIDGKRHALYINRLKKVIDKDKKYIIQVVDNSGLAKAVQQFINEKKLHGNCYLQYFYHGFAPLKKNQKFYDEIDEFVLLTNKSKAAFESFTKVLPRISVLHNGIDTKQFYKIPIAGKQLLKKEMGFEGKTVFLWCANDRPKKGLQLTLDVWKKICVQNSDVTLLVIGSERREVIEGVVFLGKIPNNELPKYYQVSDCYLFPTTYEEGFGLSLIEALHCGTYCIASAVGGVPEVLLEGKLGRLIQSPHEAAEWEHAITEFLNEERALPEIPESLYSMEKWIIGMDVIINKAKKNLKEKSKIP